MKSSIRAKSTYSLARTLMRAWHPTLSVHSIHHTKIKKSLHQRSYQLNYLLKKNKTRTQLILPLKSSWERNIYKLNGPKILLKFSNDIPKTDFFFKPHMGLMNTVRITFSLTTIFSVRRLTRALSLKSKSALLIRVLTKVSIWVPLTLVNVIEIISIE